MTHSPIRRCRLLAVAASAVAALVWALPAQANVTPLASNGKIAFSSDRDAPPAQETAFRATTAPCPQPELDKQRSGVLLGFPGDCWFDVYTMNPDGSGIVNLTKGNGGEDSYDDDPSWSPDGKQIAFASMRDCQVGDLSCGTSIYVMDADGSHVRRITDPTADESSDSHPTWSPDGKKIAFQRLPAANLGGVLFSAKSLDTIPAQAQGFGIFVVSSANDVASDGDTAEQLDTFGGSGESAFPFFVVDLLPAWSPDGAQIAFTRIMLGVPFTPGPLTDSLVRFADGDSGPAALSDLNESLVDIPVPPLDDLSFLITTGVVPAAGGDSQPVQPLDPETAFCSLSDLLDGGTICKLDTDPAWRPDGKQLAFQRHFIGFDGEASTLVNDVDLMTLDLPSLGEHNLSSGDSEGCGLPIDVPVVSATTDTTPQELTQCAGDFKPAYSPDMTRIAFHSDRNDGACISSLGLIPTCDMDLFTMSAGDGGSLSSPLAGNADGFVERNPDWQPVFPTPVKQSTTITTPVVTPPAIVPAVSKPAKPKIAVAGVRRACVARRSFRVRVRVAHTAKLKYVRVYLDGKRILTTKKSKFTIRIRTKRLKPGRHRLTTKAYDVAGNVTRSTRRIARCAAAKPKRQTGPRFTG